MSDQQPWLTLALSSEFNAALGETISQWAYFESEYDDLILIMMHHPEAKKLTDKIPFSFRKRSKLFKDAAKICFGYCQPLHKRLTDMNSRAKALKDTRDHIAHCRWAGPAETGSLQTYIEGPNKSARKVITLELLRSTIVKVSALSREIMAVSRSGMPYPDYAFPLTEEEKDAVRDFRLNNLPKLPTPEMP